MRLRLRLGLGQLLPRRCVHPGDGDGAEGHERNGLDVVSKEVAEGLAVRERLQRRIDEARVAQVGQPGAPRRDLGAAGVLAMEWSAQNLSLIHI